jgi:hypothetical protein
MAQVEGLAARQPMLIVFEDLTDQNRKVFGFSAGVHAAVGGPP